MHTLVVKNGTVVYLDELLTEKGTWVGRTLDPTTRTDNATEVYLESLPPWFMPGRALWDGNKLVPTPEYGAEILQAEKTRKLAEILTGATACAAALKSRYSELEVDSWSEQRQQAEKVLAGDTLPADALIVVLAAANAVSVDVFAQRIMANVTAAEQVTKAVVSQQQAFELIVKSIVADETMDDADKVTAITDIVVTYDLDAPRD